MLPDIKSVVKDAVTEAFSSLQEEVKDLRSENERLQKDYDELEKRVVQSENENDDLNQYGRRNILRISGIPEKTDEVTDDIVLKLAGDLNVELTKYDIDRSHRVGKVDTRGSVGQKTSSRRKHRDIIVKFTRYNARDGLFQVRKELRDIPNLDSIFISEDLTNKRSKLLYNARILRRVKKIKAAYSTNGKIYIRDNADTRHRIQSDDDLGKFGDVEAVKLDLEAARGRSSQSQRAGMSSR